MIQRPNYFNPFRHPDRAIERRNLVLDSMVETGAITKEQAERAKAEPLHLSRSQRGRQRSALLRRSGARSTAAEAGRPRLQPRRPAHLYLARSRPAARGHRGGRLHHSRRRRAGGQAARAPEETRPTVHLSAGGAGGAQSAHRPGAGAGGRAQLRQLAVEPRGGQAAHRLHLQALCLCRGLSTPPSRAPCCPGRPSSFRR